MVKHPKELLPPPDKGLGEPVRAYANTFSAVKVMMDHFFPNGPPHGKREGTHG